MKYLLLLPVAFLVACGKSDSVKNTAVIDLAVDSVVVADSVVSVVTTHEPTVEEHAKLDSIVKTVPQEKLDSLKQKARLKLDSIKAAREQ